MLKGSRRVYHLKIVPDESGDCEYHGQRYRIDEFVDETYEGDSFRDIRADVLERFKTSVRICSQLDRPVISREIEIYSRGDEYLSD